MSRNLETIEIKRKRLLFRSTHRGTREMDILLGGFFKSNMSYLNDDQLNELNIFLKDIILDRNSLMYDYIEYDYVNNLFLMHNTKNCDYSRHLWSIINFELWIRNYYKNK